MLPPRYRFSATPEQFEEQNSVLVERGYDIVSAELEDDVIYSEHIANTETNTILSSEDFDELVEVIPSQQEAGYELIDVRYSESIETWVGVFDNNAIPTTHFYTDDFDEFTAHAVEQFNLGINLVDFEYGDGIISAVFADSPHGSGYRANDNLNEFGATIQHDTIISPINLTSGRFDLVDLEYIDGTYVGILGDFLGASSYAFNYTDYDEFQAEIQRQIDEGRTFGQEFSLVDVEYIDGAWYGILNDNTDLEDPLSQDFLTLPPESVLPGVIAAEGSGFASIIPLL